MIDTILSKTAKGLRSAMSGCAGISAQQKAFLLAVDGRTTTREILNTIGLPDDSRAGAMVTSLIDGGYLRLWHSFDASPYREAKTALHVPEDPLDLDFTGAPSNTMASQA